MMTILWDDEKNKVEVLHIKTAPNTVLINVLIEARNFIGRHTFFIPSNEINKHIDTLKDMHNDLIGRLYICDNESDSFMCLHQNDGKWFLEGQLGCSWEHNMMLFRILVDQTVIWILLDFLRDIVTE